MDDLIKKMEKLKLNVDCAVVEMEMKQGNVKNLLEASEELAEILGNWIHALQNLKIKEKT
tara:strand:+ start:448 stop:627 length:180 start_codon:yes stop_codon:yes gene_type:complete